jgi:oxygen-dependent protoporphyrinogen oxidase
MFITRVETTANTAILGAGITGLCVAHAITKNEQSVHIFESQSCVGGALQTTLQNGYLAEHGPNSLLIKDQRVNQLLQDIGLSSDEQTNPPTKYLQARNEAKKRYIVHNGQPHAMPSSPIGMLRTPLFSTKGKLRFALEPFIGRYKGRDQGKEEESFGDFVRRRLGPDMLASAAGPFVSGIYAGDPDNLSVRHAFPRLWNLEHHYGSFILGAIALQLGWGKIAQNPHRLSPAQMISFQKGMHSLPQTIAQNLPENSLHLETSITEILYQNKQWTLRWTDPQGDSHSGSYKNLVIAVPHHSIPKLPLPQSILQSLTRLTQLASPPVTSLVLGFKRQDVPHPLDGFGMLIKRDENSPLLGVLFSSSMFDGRAPKDHVTLTCMMGGSLNPHYAENSDKTVLSELKRLLGINAQPTFCHRSTWKHAIPQYDLNYQQVLNVIEACETSHPGLHFAGNYRGGISVGDCIVNGLKLGKHLQNR